MSKLGIHFPNASFRNMDTLWSLPWQNVLVLHPNRDWVPEIRLRYPNATILVRAYLSNWTTKDPIAWAHEISDWANDLRGFGIEIVFANEQNLALEGHPLAARPGADYPPSSVYQDILAWDLSVIRELRALVPWATIHFPALSEGHSDDHNDAGYVGFEILRPAVELCDIVDAHIYWDASQPGSRESVDYGRRYELLHALFPDKPIFISECGARIADTSPKPAQVEQWFDALPDYVSGACWFIWDSDSNNDAWIMRGKPSLVQEMRSYGLTSRPSNVSDSPLGAVAIASALIKTSGFASNAYAQAGSNAKRIGYGHIISDREGFQQPISEAEANELLQHDLELCQSELDQSVANLLSTNQRSALLSLLHEVGVESIRQSGLFERIAASDFMGAAAILMAWPTENALNTAEFARLRELEASLLLKDLIQSSSNQPVTAPSSPGFVSPAASWLNVRQGQCYRVIGVWYADARSPAIPSKSTDPGATNLLMQVSVRVEDASGAGIAAELVALRWGMTNETCKANVTDGSGFAIFDLNKDFQPATTTGTLRIWVQIGDCAIQGLGGSTANGQNEASPSYTIRIRKTAAL